MTIHQIINPNKHLKNSSIKKDDNAVFSNKNLRAYITAVIVDCFCIVVTCNCCCSASFSGMVTKETIFE
ncbi:hypothetical protein Pfo_009733 [Paulownia fortunei]|nr:hypothetical protein Pfo_009733 [Paulownia fortunei]